MKQWSLLKRFFLPNEVKLFRGINRYNCLELKGWRPLIYKFCSSLFNEYKCYLNNALRVPFVFFFLANEKMTRFESRKSATFGNWRCLELYEKETFLKNEIRLLANEDIKAVI